MLFLVVALWLGFVEESCRPSAKLRPCPDGLPACSKPVRIASAPSGWQSWPVVAQGKLIQERRTTGFCATGCPSYDTWRVGPIEVDMWTTNYHGSTTGHGPVHIRPSACCDSSVILYGETNGGPQSFVLRRHPTDATLVLCTESVGGHLAKGPWRVDL